MTSAIEQCQKIVEGKQCQVTYYTKNFYGTTPTTFYPTNELGHLIMFIANTETLSPYLIDRLRKSYPIKFTEVPNPNREDSE